MLRIGSRGSKLALWQANFLKQQLSDFKVESSITVIKTQGDKIQNIGFDKMEGKGFFTKEIEEALLNNQIDVAVHSMKDMPTEKVEGLVITAVSERVNPADWLLIQKESVDAEHTFKLKKGALVGTSSARRKGQLLHYRADLNIKDLRGNVPTRIEKLRQGNYDAIVLAAAGIQRLNLDISDLEVVAFNPKEFVPAPAQGVLAFQCREKDVEIRKILKQVHHSDVSELTNIERKVLKLLDGSCHLPLGVFCEKDTMGHFHTFAAWAEDVHQPMQFVRSSQSTKHMLAERIVEKLKSH
ncbi:MAG: hydroxymethylbilane synthase [Bacteroidota bacterium]